MFELPLLELAVKARTGPAQWFAEFVATFGLIVTILGCRALHERGDPGRGRPLHHGGLLVHRVDVLRQSRRHDRARVDRQLRRASRPPTSRCSSSRNSAGALAGARRHALVLYRVGRSRSPCGVGAGVMRRAIWPAATLVLMIASFGVGRMAGGFRSLPDIAATLPGDESQFSRRTGQPNSRALPDRDERGQADRLPRRRRLYSRNGGAATPPTPARSCGAGSCARRPFVRSGEPTPPASSRMCAALTKVTACDENAARPRRRPGKRSPRLLRRACAEQSRRVLLNRRSREGPR